MQTWAIIKDSFRDVLDRKLFWIMASISLFISLVMACIGFDEKGISILFGMWHIDSTQYYLGAEQMAPVLKSFVIFVIGGLFLGWAGMIAILAGTAGMFPSFMEKGAVDIVLAKPISRVRLFLAKYLGSMSFVLLQATLFVGLTFLVMWLRWGVLAPEWLWSIPLFVLLFSYIYCFCVYYGVLTRRAMPSFFLTVITWFILWIPQAGYTMLDLPLHFDHGNPDKTIRAEYPKIAMAMTCFYWVVPKTTEVQFIQGKLMNATSGDTTPLTTPKMSQEDQRLYDAGIQQEQKYQHTLSIPKSIASSLICEALILGLAMWRFCRKDF